MVSDEYIQRCIFSVIIRFIFAVPIIINTQIQAVECKWNHDGTILAICGMKMSTSERDSNMVIFYSPYGVVCSLKLITSSNYWTLIDCFFTQHLRTLKMPGREITALTWEGRSLRIAFAIDSFIYFANIRPDYIWCYFGKTVVFLNTDASKVGDNITFWDTVSNQCYHKPVDETLGIAATADHCVIAVECRDLVSKDPNIVIETNFKEKKYQLMICNSISTTVDCKYSIYSYIMTNDHKDAFDE